jgi:nitrite reductase (NADH) small subunit
MTSVKENWIRVANENEFEANLGECVLVDGHQIAVLNTNRSHWYAVENCCTHTGQPVLARGIIGDTNGEPKISCPLHKRAFSLVSGKCLNDDIAPVRIFPVKRESDGIYISLPAEPSEL